MFRLFLVVLILLNINAYSQSSFQRNTIKIGNLGMSVSNFGTIGNPLIVNDPSLDPSLEYPLNSGIEHLFEGGLWIGARVNGQPTVSTAAIDASSGYSTGAAGFEFSANLGNGITQKSSLTNSDYFSPSAISHQDFICDFTDQNTIVPGTNIAIAEHLNPMNAGVHLETYAWNYSYADYFVIMNYTITNNSTTTWDSVWMGMWSDLVVRNLSVTTDNGSAYFNKGGGGFIDSCNALYAFDVNGDVGYTNSYGSIQYLGAIWRDKLFTPKNAATFTNQGFPAPKVNANFWNFKTFNGTIYGSPANDLERYDKLKLGLDFNDAIIKSTVQTPSNRVQLLSSGPFISVEPGESYEYVIAVVCARQKETGGITGPDKDTPFAQEELVEHLGWAKRTFNGEDTNENGVLDAGEDLDGDNILDRYILPEPPAVPHTYYVAKDNEVDIFWNDAAEKSIDPISQTKDFEGYRIYRSIVGQDINDADVINNATLIAQWDNEGNNIGFNNGFESIKLSNPVKLGDDTTSFIYKFSNKGLLNGWQYIYIVTSFDKGDALLKIESLESSKIQNVIRVFPGKLSKPTGDNSEIIVYPNPYRINAAWDGGNALTHKIYFSNLPARSTITIYTSAGDIVANLDHDSKSYKGEDAKWFENYAGTESQRVFSGGEHAWDILSESRQTITQGIYLYSVKDLDTNTLYQGTFTVIK